MTGSEENRENGGTSLRDRWRHAFAIGNEYDDVLDEDEEKLLDDIAHTIHRRGLTVAAIPFLLFNKPLNIIGANLIQMGEIAFTASPVEAFLKRFLGPNYTHERLVRTLEKRCSIERLVELLEALADGRPGEECS